MLCIWPYPCILSTPVACRTVCVACFKPAGGVRCRFGDPFARKNTFADVRDVLAGMGAKPGHYITQMVGVGRVGEAK